MSVNDTAVAPEQKLFGPFVNDIPGFRDVLKETSSAVVGSAVVHVLLKRPLSDVPELCVVSTYHSPQERDSSCAMFWQYIVKQGYDNIPVQTFRRDQTDMFERFEKPALSLVFKRSDGKTISFRHMSAEQTFTAVYSVGWASHMYTFATHESIYCLFPSLTLSRESMLFERGMSKPCSHNIGYYEGLGFTFVDSERALGPKYSCKDQREILGEVEGRANAFSHDLWVYEEKGMPPWWGEADSNW
ncbi:hypothetical protein N7471_010315 [Penicillium samsonianum]|uniref:uncharacterized protein n=1 Tax=Penicillium samsonianum TaxID=1882272 RepID=UPI0025499396|nr:uncharacterized protein N7471_010315 [Penicillium samsonianum]KAJ6125822.1 hypothetical protein N7471_010315 [Penicillium samsonianum]